MKRELAPGPGDTAKFLLNRLRENQARDPKNDRRAPLQNFESGKRQPSVTGTLRGEDKFQKRVAMQRFDDGEPSDERKIQRPAETPHVAEPDGWGAVRRRRERAAAKPRNDNERK